MAEIPIWVPVATALAGGGLVGIINFAMRWQDRKAEERRHLQHNGSGVRSLILIFFTTNPFLLLACR